MVRGESPKWDYSGAKLLGLKPAESTFDNPFKTGEKTMFERFLDLSLFVAVIGMYGYLGFQLASF